MKANDLMFGDWVQSTFMGNKVPCKVVGISTDILSNRPFKKGELWERKTCKTCAMLDEKRCTYCKTEFGQYRIKPKHKACRNYKPKND